MWNYSYRTPTECWQKTSDLPKGKKTPMDLGREKEKKKKQRQKNREVAVKEEQSPHTREPLHWWGWGGGQGGSFGATEISAATRVQRAKQRYSYTEDRC